MVQKVCLSVKKKKKSEIEKEAHLDYYLLYLSANTNNCYVNLLSVFEDFKTEINPFEMYMVSFKSEISESKYLSFKATSRRSTCIAKK